MTRTNAVLMLLGGVLMVPPALAQQRPDERRQTEPPALSRTSSYLDRAQNVVTINKLGQAVTNMGQFYAFSGTLPSGRWPLGTDHDAIYRMNMYIGVPYNVVATRARNTKEWDAVGGYHNPVTGKLAISTDRTTWPLNGSGQPYWPVRTVDGRDSITSQEDSYGIYRDLTNFRQDEILNIVVHQSSYAWSTSKDQDYIFFRFDIINDTTVARDSLYFALYCDFDAGGPVSDFEDDKWGLDLSRDFFYIYDTDGISIDWPGVEPFFFGCVFLETPEVNGVRPGITDWHYSSDKVSPWGDNLVEDTVLYNWMSSNIALKNDPNWPNLFHGGNLRIDDVSLIDPAGERLDAIASSGPYRIEPGEKLTFIIALVAGQDYDAISANADRLRQVYQNGLKLVPPPRPEVLATAYDNRIQLSWGNAQEFTYTDPQTGESLVKEYRIYKTQDPERKIWGDPVAVLPRDTTLAGPVTGAYTWVDTAGIRNFNYYSYSVTILDRDSLESGKSFLPADQTALENTVEVRPVSSARTDLNRIRVVPNPYIISASWERKRLGDPLLGEPVRDLAFTNLPTPCTIRIYTLDGDLIDSIEHTAASGTAFWDLRTFANQLVATGIYFYHIQSEQGETIGKFAIVR